MSALRRRFEPLITPLFRAYWRAKRSMTLGVRGVVTDERGRLLLVRHTYVSGWYLPGGGVESGETAPEALARELREEGGVELSGAPDLIGVYSQHRVFPNDHVLLYHVPSWRPCPPDARGEIAEHGFFSPQTPPPETTAATLRRIAEVFSSAPISPYW